MTRPGGVVAVGRRVLTTPPRELAQRVVRRAYERVGAAELDFPLLTDDVADSARVRHEAAPPVPADRPLVVGWVCTPPSGGSGGHTTMFRMVQALERAGHRCVVLLYERHGAATAERADVIRWHWPQVQAEVRSVDEGFGGLDVVVATGWETAHVLASRAPAGVHRAYFVQDYEPFFYPHGSEYQLAADSYRFGFTTIALGHMVQERLATELNVASELVPFSCDTSVYRLHNRGPRNGVVLYAKPGVPRRGFRLAAMALQEFHDRHPEHEIHVYGERVPDLGVPVHHHGRLAPAELNDLYNRVVAGLAMSFTNISLVAEEMLAAGCVPVVNDDADARADLESLFVAWARPTPSGLAAALSSAVEHDSPGVWAAAAAASVRCDDWTAAGDRLTAIIAEVARGEHHASN